MTESSKRILPCPFCGSEASLEVSHVLEDGITQSAYVYCTYCGAEGQRISPHSIANAKLPEGVYAGLEMLDDARAEADQAAVDAWNTRVLE